MRSVTLLRSAIVGTGVAVLLVLAVYLAANLANDPLEVQGPGGELQEVAMPAMVLFTVLGGVAGMTLAVLASRLNRSASAFAAICVFGLVIYGLVPFFAAEATSTAIWLNLMHIAAAIPIVGTMMQWLRQQPPKPTIDGPQLETE